MCSGQLMQSFGLFMALRDNTTLCRFRPILAKARRYVDGSYCILKIETRQAFEQLPSLLMAAMSSPRTGVMIARGDLAVECGYQRLAEVQEEILWICEAAHVPSDLGDSGARVSCQGRRAIPL